MLLATRCPFCETVFRLQSAQLALRRGLVRCGHCHEVFDATSSLYETVEGADFSAATPIPAAAASELVPGRPAEPPPEPPLAPQPEPLAEAWPEPPADARPEPLRSAEAEVEAEAHAEPEPEPLHSALPEPLPEPLPNPQPEPLPNEHPEPLPNAHPEPAAARLPGRPAGPDFSAEAWDPWAPAADAVIDDRLRHRASHLPHAGIATGAGVAVTPRSGIEPELPQHASGVNLPRDDEPTFPDAPLEPFAYDRDPPAEATPSVWHKTARPSTHVADEPVLRESATLYDSVPDGEPRFNSVPYDTAHDASPSHVATEPFAVTPPEDGVDPFPVVRETRAPEPSRAGWIVLGTLLALLLIVVLLAQLAWWQRETIMVDFPRTQVVYAQACAKLGCQLAPPHDIDGLQVEPSDLRQVDGPHKLELKMPLRNRFNVALAYPAIELTLLDDRNNVALRRVLWPQDYVTPGTPIGAGLAAHTTQTMIVRLDTGTAIASNFRVQIFYP